MSFDSFVYFIYCGGYDDMQFQRKSKVMIFFFIFIVECGGISGVGGLVFFYFMYFVFSISLSDNLCFLEDTSSK